MAPSFQIIPSISLDSGTGIRLKGMCKALNALGHTCSIAGCPENTVKNPGFVIASKALPNSCMRALLKRSKKTKTILDFDDLEWSYWQPNAFMKNTMLASEKIFAKRFDLYTVHTEPLRQYLQQTYSIPRQKILFFGQGIDYAIFKKTRPKKKSRKIMYSAHLGSAARDAVEIFNVFAKVSGSFPDAELEVVGDGMFRKSYEKQAKKTGARIKFVGYVPHEKIPGKFSEAGLAVNYMAGSLANRYRSSIKVREYLASALPTVCNEIGDISIFSKYLETFPTGNLNAFEDNLYSALSKPDYAKALRGKAFVEKNWDWKIVAKKFLKQLEALS